MIFLLISLYSKSFEIFYFLFKSLNYSKSLIQWCPFYKLEDLSSCCYSHQQHEGGDHTQNQWKEGGHPVVSGGNGTSPSPLPLDQTRLRRREPLGLDRCHETSNQMQLLSAFCVFPSQVGTRPPAPPCRSSPRPLRPPSSPTMSRARKRERCTPVVGLYSSE